MSEDAEQWELEKACNILTRVGVPPAVLSVMLMFDKETVALYSDKGVFALCSDKDLPTFNRSVIKVHEQQDEVKAAQAESNLLSVDNKGVFVLLPESWLFVRQPPELVGLGVDREPAFW